jgi:hypothetical protein
MNDKITDLIEKISDKMRTPITKNTGATAKTQPGSYKIQ